MIKEIPILFSTPMVQANLDGRKTMTRRMMGLGNVNEDPNQFEFVRIQYYDDCCKAVFINKNTGNTHIIKCSYGQPEDLLWVRETWAPAWHQILYKANERYGKYEGQKFKPSIHMPKAAARIWLQVEEIRVERLQDINEEDAIAEGVSYHFKHPEYFKNYMNENEIGFIKAWRSFQTLWIKINGPESWDLNPWVWVVKFKVLSTTGKPTF